MAGLYEPFEKATAQCRQCGEVFGTGHAEKCSVKFREVTSADVQRYHENLDRFYEQFDIPGGFHGLSVKPAEPPRCPECYEIHFGPCRK
jgi:hypothetical protein